MEKELEVIINIGVPASGKSSWTKEFIKKNPKYVKVSRDDFRYMLRNEGWCEPKVEKMITKLHNDTIVTALNNKFNVIVDNTNLKVSAINEIVNLVKSYADVRFEVFDVPYETLLERDSKRERSVGKDVIDMMWKNWINLKSSFGFEPIKRVKTKSRYTLEQDPSLPKAILIDVDGTLAIANNRNIFDETRVLTDDVNEPVANIVRQYNGVKIVVSGRMDSCRSETEKWLELNNIPYDLLFMRKAGDCRKDLIIKKEIFENNIRDKFFIEYSLDDRNQVVSGWRELGLLCLQVYDGNF